MFKSKSFNLVHEEDLKKSKNPNKYGWTRFLICPVIIGFMLLLIMVNVDFSGKPCKQEITTGTEGLHSTFITEADEIEDGGSVITALSSENTTEVLEETVSSLTEPTQAQEISNRFGEICSVVSNPCIVNCQIFNNEKELNTWLETQQLKCDPDDFQLTITASIFSGSKLGKNFLSGNFRVETLFLNQGILNGIDNNAFKKASLKGLKKLIIEGFGVAKLNQQTFVGLESITYFKMTNKEDSSKLNAKEFIMPMADTLTEMIFCQSSMLYTHDPTNWFSGKDLAQLSYVDLSGNAFPDTLNEKTFATFVRIESLILRNCRIKSFEENTFSEIFSTLKYLDLSKNNLKTLSTDFLLGVSLHNINISLSSNEWNCDCDNNEFVETIQQNGIVFDQEPKCSKPTEWYNKEIKQVQNYCDGNSPTTISTTVEIQSTDTDSTTETMTTESEITTTTETTSTTDTIETTSTTDIIETTLTTDIPETSYTTDPAPTSIPESSEEIISTPLECRSTIDLTVSLVSIRNKTIDFVLRIISTNTISIEFEDFYEDIQLIYFSPKHKDSAVTFPITDSKTLIDDLFSEEDYIFCALTLNQENFSPYNCQSYHTALYIRQEKKKPWLNANDMPLFISLSTMGVLGFLFIGIASIFFILRSRPTLLKGSKRLLKLSNHSQQVFLCKYPNELSIEELYEALRTYAPVYGKTMDNLSNNDYLQFYMDEDASHTIYAGINFIENLPPDQRAPALPPFQRERQYSGQSTIPADDNITHTPIDEIIEEHEYQSLDQYQEIYGLQ